jgi:KDO2-lipid IV(A) lauroyltransferase
MKHIRYFIEAAFVYLLIFIFGLMPADAASAIGGWLGRIIGPRLATSRKARRNLKLVFPDMSDEQHTKTIKGMCDNLGRMMAEYPHLETLAKHNTEFVGEQHVRAALERNKGIVFVGGHIGNWEMKASGTLFHLGFGTDISYRAPNNPWVDRLLKRMRSLDGRIRAHAKSSSGGRHMMETIKNGGSLVVLIDQKYNQGTEMPFFGHPAMTNTFFAKLAQKYDATVIPIRSERLDGAKFRLTYYEPLQIEGRSAEDITQDVHTLLENWITERPAQWLWLHRRWKDQKNDHQAL